LLEGNEDLVIAVASLPGSKVAVRALRELERRFVAHVMS
jgi:hypothetical protein